MFGGAKVQNNSLLAILITNYFRTIPIFLLQVKQRLQIILKTFCYSPIL